MFFLIFIAIILILLYFAINQSTVIQKLIQKIFFLIKKKNKNLLIYNVLISFLRSLKLKNYKIYEFS